MMRWVNKSGRIVVSGADFKRATRDNSYPITVYEITSSLSHKQRTEET